MLCVSYISGTLENKSSFLCVRHTVLSSGQSFLVKPLSDESPPTCSPASLIQEMNSQDPAVRASAVLRTEQRLLSTEEQDEDRCRTALDRTVVSPAHAPAEGSFSCVDVRTQAQRGVRAGAKALVV